MYFSVSPPYSSVCQTYFPISVIFVSPTSMYPGCIPLHPQLYSLYFLYPSVCIHLTLQYLCACIHHVSLFIIYIYCISVSTVSLCIIYIYCIPVSTVSLCIIYIYCIPVSTVSLCITFIYCFPVSTVSICIIYIYCILYITVSL